MINSITILFKIKYVLNLDNVNWGDKNNIHWGALPIRGYGLI